MVFRQHDDGPQLYFKTVDLNFFIFSVQRHINNQASSVILSSTTNMPASNSKHKGPEVDRESWHPDGTLKRTGDYF